MRTVCVQRVSKALLIRTLRWKHAVHSLPACGIFHNPDSNCFFNIFYGWTVRRLCVTGTNSGQRKHNRFRACALLVPRVYWRWSGVLLAFTFTRGKKCTPRLTYTKKCTTFIRRSRQIINKFSRTPRQSQRTDQNSSFFVRWTCVMVCVTGPLANICQKYSTRRQVVV